MPLILGGCAAHPDPPPRTTVDELIHESFERSLANYELDAELHPYGEEVVEFSDVLGSSRVELGPADDFYAELLAVHEGRTKEESDAINARLILLLANHIGDRATLSEAMKKAVEAGN